MEKGLSGMRERIINFIFIIVIVLVIGMFGAFYINGIKKTADFLAVEVRIEDDENLYNGLMSKYDYEMWAYGDDDRTLELRGVKDYRFNAEHVVSITVIEDWEE